MKSVSLCFLRAKKQANDAKRATDSSVWNQKSKNQASLPVIVRANLRKTEKCTCLMLFVVVICL
jgi:hypothetical protein